MSVSTYQELVSRRAKVTGSGDFAAYGWLRLSINPRLLARSVYAAVVIDGVSDYALSLDLALLHGDAIRWIASTTIADRPSRWNYGGATTGWGTGYGTLLPETAVACGWPASRVTPLPEGGEYDSEPASDDALVWYTANDNGYGRNLYRVTCWPLRVIARADALGLRVTRRSQTVSAPSFAFEFFLACGSAAL